MACKAESRSDRGGWFVPPYRTATVSSPTLSSGQSGGGGGRGWNPSNLSRDLIIIYGDVFSLLYQLRRPNASLGQSSTSTYFSCHHFIYRTIKPFSPWILILTQVRDGMRWDIFGYHATSQRCPNLDIFIIDLLTYQTRLTREVFPVHLICPSSITNCGPHLQLWLRSNQLPFHAPNKGPRLDFLLMQLSDDALDFYDSLLIFHRICPFAVENLPIMSRRVFDVGLDLGRIRNGLKHKDGKSSKSFRSNSTKDDSLVDDTPLPNQNNTLVPRHRKSNPNLATKQQKHQHTLSNEEPVVLPSANLPAGMDSEFPLPPSKRTSPEYNQLNENGDRSLHSSQLFPSVPSNSSPESAPKPERRRSSDNAQNFDLKPPPNSKVKNVDTLSEQIFSGDHLRVILKDPSFFLRFTAFLNRYRPHSAPILVRYLEAQKAIKAVEYANALAETMRPISGEHSSPCPAASIDPRFEARSKRSFESLVDDALPAYITNCLTKVVTESMVREITGQGMPVMRELVGGLAEVFCLADPSIKDCPIVYASEEFYRTSRYSRDDVLGRNCRFLQGPKTNRKIVARIGAAIKSGQESCETVLNYRRDGTPFMNLLLTAPLYDNRGSVRYFIGAQIDVSGLIEDGRGLDSFAHYLAESRPNRKRDSEQSLDGISQKHLKTLSEFGQMLSLDESSVFHHHSRASSVQDNASTISYRGNQSRQEPGLRRTRRVLGNDEDEDDGKDKNSWALSSVGPSGKLPGVYQNVPISLPLPFHIPYLTSANSTSTVPSRPPSPLVAHHLRLPRSPHPWPPPIALAFPHRRSFACPWRPSRRLRIRRCCHRKSDVATARSGE